jgi:hypothetical protein
LSRFSVRIACDSLECGGVQSPTSDELFEFGVEEFCEFIATSIVFDAGQLFNGDALRDLALHGVVVNDDRELITEGIGEFAQRCGCFL